MAQILLEKYLGTPQFDDFLDQFYDSVTQHDLVKHFFIVAKKPAVLQDLKRYWPYLLPKSTLEYRKPATPTSSYEIQLPESQFSEIVILMTKITTIIILIISMIWIKSLDMKIPSLVQKDYL